MSRRIISAIVATTIALGAMAPAPAIAGNDDLKRLLGGIATVVILGATYDHLRDRRKERRHVDPPVIHRPREVRKTVPAQCLRRIETRHGVQRFFGQRCLERNMRNAHRLPQACAVQIRTYNGPRRGYAPRCLRDFGWRAV